jgi:tRNA threonylcarbamoyladenosine biosynthesis protein TsaB
MLLAIDTSTRYSSAALYHDGEVVAEDTWWSGEDHTRFLLPVIDDLRRRVGRRLGEALLPLTAIAVAQGPGSFNGLRVGISTAKGFALALGIPLAAVPTLDVLAFQHRYAGVPVCAVLDAGRGEVYSGIFRGTPRQWRVVGECAITSMVELADRVAALNARHVLFCGELRSEQIQVLRERLGDRALLAHPAAALRRAGYLAYLGWQRIQEGKTADPVTLEPIYLRRPHITVSKRPQTLVEPIHEADGGS